MKICLAMMVRDEMGIIPRTLPIYLESFEHRVALDTGSADGTAAWLSDHGFRVILGDWNSNFSSSRNQLLDEVKSYGFDWCVMLDADETMFPADVISLVNALPSATSPVIYLPRYNIAGNYDRWWNKTDPDYQGRVIKLGSGIRFTNPVHEVPTMNGDGRPAIIQGHGCISDQPIYHYGLCKNAESIWRRTLNYRALARGEREPNESGETPPANFSHLPMFDLPHPLHA